MDESYVEKILKARVYDVAIESPLEAAPRLSRRLANDVWFKREDLQPVFSFKLRGAYNKIASLGDEVARRGVICASAGNHAQGVALAARRRSIPAVIVMPRTTPEIKIQAVREFGAEVVLHGDDFDHAYEHALGIMRERGLTLIHPFDDPDVIAGQGTIGMEILRQHSGQARCDLRADRRRWPDRRHRDLRQVAVPAGPHRRRRARGRGQHVRIAACAAHRDAGAGRHLRRRRRRAARRRGDVPARAALRRRGRAREHRRDLRGDPGHFRGQPHDRRARRSARRGGHQALRRTRGLHRPTLRRAQLRGQHQLRPPAARRRARRHRRRARGAVRGRDPGDAGQLPAFLPGARQPQRDRVQLPLRRCALGAHLRRRVAARRPARARTVARGCRGRAGFARST